MVTSKYIIERHKNKVHTALIDLEKTINICGREVPRAVARLISDHIKQFEKNCSCNSLKK